jgi:pilus assembly protein CpaE
LTGALVIVFIDRDRDARDAIADEIGTDVVVEWAPNPGTLDTRLTDASVTIEAVVLGTGVVFEDSLKTAERLSLSHPDLGVILLLDHADAPDLRRAIRAGVLDVLDLRRAPGELREAIDRSRARFSQLHAQVEGAHEGRLVLVFSTKGGCGTSFVASNLAVALAERFPEGVGLVDLALSSGDLSIMLQLLPAWSVYDAALQGSRLDQEALRGFLTEHGSGVHLLAAPNDPAVAEQVTPDAVQHLLGLLRTLFPVTIVDTPAYFSDQVLAAIDVADELVLVTSLDVPAVKNLKLALQTLEALHVGRERIRVVLNRADSSVGLRVAEVERSLGTEIDVSIPSSRDVPLSVNQGIPIYQSRKKRSSVVSAIEELAGTVAASLPMREGDQGTRRRSRGRR